ncbi:MAG: rhodanese domain-containing protein [Pseudomonadota bacterium]
MSESVTISTFYSFSALADPAALRAPILARMEALGIRGTITLAAEGINATISGGNAAIQSLMEFLNGLIQFTTPTFRESYDAAQPFKRAKVKVKRELIALGAPTFPAQCVGRYVMPADWNALITAGDVIIIDTRNDYEFAFGHFAGAVNPATRNFKEMVAFTERHLDPASGKRIAMYCTGGIRCDKYSSYLVAEGFGEVYHLHGGILAYLEQIPLAQSLWQGSCFVFDERVSVGHGLVPALGQAA